MQFTGDMTTKKAKGCAPFAFFPQLEREMFALADFEFTEFILQTLPGMEDAALHSAHGNAQFVGNLIIVEAIQKHGKGLSEVVLEAVDGRLNVVDVDQRCH